MKYDLCMRMRHFLLLVSVLALGSPTVAAQKATEKKVIVPPGPRSSSPFSPGLLVGNTLYIAGQIGRDDNGKIPESFEDEVKQTLENVGKVLKEAGLTFADAVSSQVFLTDMTLFDRMNAVYREFFPEPRPVRTTVGVAKLVGTARIEITIIAHATAKPKKKNKN
jgi:reactive intermediate/imine deaminase